MDPNGSNQVNIIADIPGQFAKGGSEPVWQPISAPRRTPFDFDRDGKADISIWRASNNSWWYVNSSDLSAHGHSFGLPDDIITPGDFTGDGKADIAVFRPSNGIWYVMRSEDNSYYSLPFGLNGDVPAAGDYDGDGRFDTAVFRPTTGTWYVNGSTAGSMIMTFGLSGDRPIANAFAP